MKVDFECASCMLNKAVNELKEATENPALRFRAIVDIIRLLREEFKINTIPANLGTKRELIIKRITGNHDTYKNIKRKSNEMALKLLPYVQEMFKGSYTQKDRFKKAIVFSIVGNAIEFYIPGHNFKFNMLKRSLQSAEKDLIIDDTQKIYEIVKVKNKALFLTDNAGEVVLDTLLVEQLRSVGLKVVVAVKDEPIVNDATIEDVKISGMDKVADKIITTGNCSIGLSLRDSSAEFLKNYNSADIVFAKGMGYAETITEYNLEKPHVLLFRSKCNPLANFFNIPKGKNVAKLL
jgi:uncharacterized protein with ATP-grasp and redox domains